MPVTHAQLSDDRIGISEAAAILQVHPDTIRRAVKRREIVFSKTPGGHYRFNRADVEALLTPSIAAPQGAVEGVSASPDAA